MRIEEVCVVDYRNMASLVEEGFKEVSGYLTEGRWLVFEQNGYAMTNAGDDARDITLTPTTDGHEARAQRWMVEAQSGLPLEGGKGREGTYYIKSAQDARYLSSHTSLGHDPSREQ